MKIQIVTVSTLLLLMACGSNGGGNGGTVAFHIPNNENPPPLTVPNSDNEDDGGDPTTVPDPDTNSEDNGGDSTTVPDPNTGNEDNGEEPTTVPDPNTGSEDDGEDPTTVTDPDTGNEDDGEEPTTVPDPDTGSEDDGEDPITVTDPEDEDMILPIPKPEFIVVTHYPPFGEIYGTLVSIDNYISDVKHSMPLLSSDDFYSTFNIEDQIWDENLSLEYRRGFSLPSKLSVEGPEVNKLPIGSLSYTYGGYSSFDSHHFVRVWDSVEKDYVDATGTVSVTAYFSSGYATIDGNATSYFGGFKSYSLKGNLNINNRNGTISGTGTLSELFLPKHDLIIQGSFHGDEATGVSGIYHNTKYFQEGIYKVPTDVAGAFIAKR